MIKIRYSDLPAGFHVRTAVEGRHTILYLLPGLTPAERRSAIGRARSNARVGYGPRLPAGAMAAAMAADQIRTTLGNGYKALRLNPAFFVPAAVVIASVAVAYVLLASVSIQLHEPPGAGPVPQPNDLIRVVPGYSRLTPAARPGGGPARPRQPAGARGRVKPGRGGSRGHAPGRGAGPSPSLRPTPTSPASPQPLPDDPPTIVPLPTPAPSPSPSATGMCLELGSLGVCLR
ncbi:MAG TPA: hypothetical protein VH637_18200 [Streptosporangiaceae bacterium]